jgi:hypothetical protein
MKLDADCVLYMAQGEGDPDGAQVVEPLEATCAQGGTSFHGTGIQPGWAAEVLPLTMSGLFSRIDALLVQELLDYSTYGSALMDRPIK